MRLPFLGEGQLAQFEAVCFMAKVQKPIKQMWLAMKCKLNKMVNHACFPNLSAMPGLCVFPCGLEIELKSEPPKHASL